MIIRKNTIYANFILLLNLKQKSVTHKKFAYMVFYSNNQIRIIYLRFPEFQLVSTNCFSVRLAINRKIISLI